MPDLERLQANVEEAQIFSEMALSQLMTARASVRERRIRWAEIHARRLEAIRAAGSAAATTAPEVSREEPAVVS